MPDDWNTDQVWQRWLEEYYEKHPMTEQTVNVIAEITLLPTEEGGRMTPVLSGYRGQFYYEGYDWDACYTFASDPVAPGQTREAMIQFLRPEAHFGRIHVGMAFGLREGSRTVGRGVVTWVHEALHPHGAV